jgi:hypothetical protein
MFGQTLLLYVGCKFHVAQCWFKKIQTLGLVNEYRNKNSEIGKFLRLFFGLHYLKSSDVSDVFAFDLFDKMPDDVKVVKFCDYVLDNYISDEAPFPPELWASDSASTCRTTNVCESFHSKFNECFYNTHPNIFQFLSVLKDFQCEVYIKIHTANRFVKKVRKDVAEKQKLVNSKIAACYVRSVDK